MLARKRGACCALFIGALFMSASLVSYVRAQAKSPPDFKHFQMVKTIRFDNPDTLLIGTIDHMDVDPEGRILVVDWRGKQVLLFDSTGALQASLDPVACHPGFTFHPLTAHFGGYAFIFIQNSIPWGYRFTADGGCLGSVVEDFVGDRFFDIDPAGTLYGSYPGLPDRTQRTLRRMSPSGETLEDYPMPPSKYPNATQGVVGGGLIADGEHLYYASAPERDILKFSLDGTLLDRISERSSWFRSPRQDLPRDMQARLKEFGKWSEGTTTMMGLFELTDQMLMVYHSNDDRGAGTRSLPKTASWLLKSWASSWSSSFTRETGCYIVRFTQAAAARVIIPIPTWKSTGLSRHDAERAITPRRLAGPVRGAVRLAAGKAPGLCPESARRKLRMERMSAALKASSPCVPGAGPVRSLLDGSRKGVGSHEHRFGETVGKLRSRGAWQP